MRHSILTPPWRSVDFVVRSYPKLGNNSWKMLKGKKPLCPHKIWHIDNALFHFDPPHYVLSIALYDTQKYKEALVKKSYWRQYVIRGSDFGPSTVQKIDRATPYNFLKLIISSFYDKWMYFCICKYSWFFPLNAHIPLYWLTYLILGSHNSGIRGSKLCNRVYKK